MYRTVVHYTWNLFIAVDQLVNTILGGDPDETVSSRASKNSNKWYWRPLIAFLEFIDPGHMKRSREEDEGEDSVL